VLITLPLETIAINSLSLNVITLSVGSVTSSVVQDDLGMCYSSVDSFSSFCWFDENLKISLLANVIGLL
jgi:hypothetical protein